MQKRILHVCAAALLLCTYAQSATAGESNHSRVTLRNSTGIELLGNSFLYSFYYQRMVSPSLGLDAGLAMYGGGDGGSSTFVAFIPVGAKVYLIPKSGSIYLTGGGVFLTATTDIGLNDDESASIFYGYAGLGFEHRAESGFVFRFTAYNMFIEGSYFIWPGLTLGYAF
ncbi:hypothetical protein HUU05_11295 [candidate division KSB1 bacterium]|nr:hypothetical protein [candidate division KSB1 bacterium]